MISTKILGTGTTLLIIGVLSLGAYLFGLAEDPLFFTLGSFSAFVGFVTMVLGFFSLAGGEFGKKDLMEAGDSAVFTVGLIRCMIAISVADDYLDDTEILQISKIYKHLTKTEISDDVIRQTAADMQEIGFKIEDELETIKPTLNRELKEKIVIASLYILAADGDMDERELIMLDDIREALGISLKIAEAIKANFFANTNVG